MDWWEQELARFQSTNKLRNERAGENDPKTMEDDGGGEKRLNL